MMTPILWPLLQSASIRDDQGQTTSSAKIWRMFLDDCEITARAASKVALKGDVVTKNEKHYKITAVLRTFADHAPKGATVNRNVNRFGR